MYISIDWQRVWAKQLENTWLTVRTPKHRHTITEGIIKGSDQPALLVSWEPLSLELPLCHLQLNRPTTYKVAHFNICVSTECFRTAPHRDERFFPHVRNNGCLSSFLQRNKRSPRVQDINPMSCTEWIFFYCFLHVSINDRRQSFPFSNVWGSEYWKMSSPLSFS